MFCCVLNICSDPFLKKKKGGTPKGPEAAVLNGGNTDYIEDLQKERNYNTSLNFYKKDPRHKMRNAIRSFATMKHTAAVTCATAGDKTTWQ